VTSGWEVPKWFSQDGEMPAVEHRFERQSWFKYNLIEHQAVRSSLGLIDKTFMAKFIVEGRDAARVLDRVSANSIAMPIGRNVYTQWLNDSAGNRVGLDDHPSRRYSVPAGDLRHSATLNG